MKLPLSWLKDYVDIDVSVNELEEKLFSCGFEVEETIRYAEKVDKIVTCKIMSIEKHPNADKLSVTKVDAGKYGELQIVTNAKNIAVGDVVPVAVDGATLFNGERIFKGELRGVKSDGMFCSGEELGITDDFYFGASFNGVLVFRENFPLGEEVKKLLDIEDVIFDINVTANRPDCQSILGLAREVSAVLGKPFKMPDLSFKTDDSVSTLDTVKITDHDYELCPRYMGYLVKDVKIAPSPEFIKKRLFRMGLRSINNIVDITNFVLLEIGQPMHAFDLSDLCGNEINIRRANDGEKIVTLDEKEFTLTRENLVICDAVKPVALAGVMGGLNSEIKDTTKDVLFESARFKRDNIRKTSRSLGQKSDSSSRYEKGVDFFSVQTGLARALHLIDELGCGRIAKDGYDLTEKPVENKVIKTTYSKVNAVLGIEVPKNVVKDILQRLFFKVEGNGDELILTVPLFREDMESYPDIAEEVIREYGYSHIEPSLLKTSAITNGGLNESQRKLESLKDLLVGFGFNEAITYSFVSEKEYDLFGLDKNSKEHKFIKIMNPIGEDMAVMRTTLVPSIIRAVCNNLNRKNESGRLFETAKIYNSDEDVLTKLPKESMMLSFALFGEDEDFFTAKGVVEGILSEFCSGVDADYVRPNLPFLHPTRSADILLCGEKVGYFGQLNPELTAKLDVTKPIFVGEINYELLSKYFNGKIVVTPVSKYPTVERDLAVTVDEDVTWGEIVKVVKRSAGEYLSAVKLFDIYRSELLGSKKKSMAFNMVFVSFDRTLTVEEIDDAIKNVLKNLKIDLGAELR